MKVEIKKLKEWINEFNDPEQEYVYADYLVIEAFREKISPYSQYRRVVLLDTLFKTNLPRSKPKDDEKRKNLFVISEQISQKLSKLNEKLHKLRSRNLFELDLSERSKDSEILKCALEEIISCTNNNSISFSGKYLHFTFPHLFPPWDQYVPQAVNELGFKPPFPKYPTSQRHYIELCKSYQEIEKSIAKSEQNEIIILDYNKQPHGWQTQNTLIRIIDKALWIRGRNKK